MSNDKRVLETRRQGLLTFRRYRYADRRTLKTVEIPWSAWLEVRDKVLARMPAIERTAQRAARNVQVMAMLDRGDSRAQIAQALGIRRGTLDSIITRCKTRDKPKRTAAISSVFQLGESK